MSMTFKVVLFACLVVVGAASFSSATDHTVLMNGDYFAMFFDPVSITIQAGDRVQWQNVVAVIHTATAGTDCVPDGTWTSGSVNPGATSPLITFDTPGAFPYFCRFHCDLGMTGEVIVTQTPLPTRHTTWGAIKALYAVSPK